MRYIEHASLSGSRRSRKTLALLAALLLTLPSTALPFFDASKEDLLWFHIFYDMMYGADDYFGEDADLSYADHVVPSKPEKVADAAADGRDTTSDTTSDQDADTKKDTEQPKGDPPVDDPPDDDPPDDPPDDEPPPPPEPPPV